MIDKELCDRIESACLLVRGREQVAQIVWINKGLARFPAVKFVPAYSAGLSLLGSAIGSVYFQEYLYLGALGVIMWPVGAGVVGVGILVLLFQADTSGKAGSG